MRLGAALLAGILAIPALAATPAAIELRARGDAMRRAGDYEGALKAYEEARARGGDDAETWKRIGWTQKAMRHFAEAAAALEKALAIDPGDREARDDLAALKLGRGLRLTGWLGGTEPGTSKSAVEGQAWYGGLDALEMAGGGSWTDNIFYESAKGYANAYWFYAPDSYARADVSLRKYGYTGASRPTPDSNAYELVPRLDLEVSHWVGRRVRLALGYQLFTPNFYFDQGTWVVNHKLSGEAEIPLGGGFSAGLMAAFLRDPSPAYTEIKGRPLPGAPPGTVCPGSAGCAVETKVVYRTELLLGGGLAYQAERWAAGVRYIPNRDLDSGFAWSILSRVEVQPQERLSFELQWIHDRYATSSNVQYSGKNGDILWGLGRYQLTPALALAGGLKWVVNPGPRSTTSPPGETRNDGTLLVQVEYRTGAF